VERREQGEEVEGIVDAGAPERHAHRAQPEQEAEPQHRPSPVAHGVLAPEPRVDGRPAQDSLARGAGGAKESAAGGGVRAWPAGVAGVRGGQGRRVSQRGWTLHAVTMRLTVDEILDRLGAGVAQRVRPLAGWLESEEPAPREEPRPEDLAHLTRAERPDLGCGLLRRDLGEVPGDLEGLAPWLDRAEARRAKGAPPRWTRHTRRRLRVARAAGSLAAAARSAHASAIDPQILAGIATRSNRSRSPGRPPPARRAPGNLAGPRGARAHRSRQSGLPRSGHPSSDDWRRRYPCIPGPDWVS
jgi:hypothetical protein